MSDVVRERPVWWRQRGCILTIVGLLLAVGVGLWLFFSFYQGRDLARVTGIPVQIGLPECVQSYDQVVSISFHSRGSGETIKDVTYMCDNRLYSQEYNDFGILQGTIEWTLRK